ncbi:histidine phosphatase family protein [Pannus brasiliensis CCIBt3594]|uniref:phosphoglycerate mutase (2,3-diphosphoglycerate-dependent) n=1 Tax=Pannus brasiliensis CCIBt3594 TaxID=1427578 RepID=A0AAW9QR15_9CHRO
MTLKLYFLRHGETTASQVGSFCGRLNLELTPAGYEMAEDFALAYRDLPWTAIYCSPLQRTLATATIMSELVGVPLEKREGLKEIAYGQWEGKTAAEVTREFHDDYVRWLADPGWNPPTGGEKGIDIARRSSEVLEEIEHRHETGNVLVVSHKATIRIMLCSLLGIDVGRYRDRIAMPVASLTIVELSEHGPLFHVMGDRSHLRPDLRARVGT